MKTYIVKYILLVWMQTTPNNGYTKQEYHEYKTKSRDSAYSFYNRSGLQNDIKKVRLDSLNTSKK